MSSTVEKRFMTLSLSRYRGLRVRRRLEPFSAAKTFGEERKKKNETNYVEYRKISRFTVDLLLSLFIVNPSPPPRAPALMTTFQNIIVT